jgi:hypothetical protein
MRRDLPGYRRAESITLARIIAQGSPDLINAEIDAPVEIHERVIARRVPRISSRVTTRPALHQQGQELEMLRLEMILPALPLCAIPGQKIELKSPKARKMRTLAAVRSWAASYYGQFPSRACESNRFGGG